MLCVWDPAKDAKLNDLYDLVNKKYPHSKVLIFTQYADTVATLQISLETAK